MGTSHGHYHGHKPWALQRKSCTNHGYEPRKTHTQTHHGHKPWALHTLNRRHKIMDTCEHGHTRSTNHGHARTNITSHWHTNIMGTQTKSWTHTNDGHTHTTDTHKWWTQKHKPWTHTTHGHTHYHRSTRAGHRQIMDTTPTQTHRITGEVSNFDPSTPLKKRHQQLGRPFDIAVAGMAGHWRVSNFDPSTPLKKCHHKKGNPVRHRCSR